MQTGSKILDSEGKTGLELLNSASKVQFCGDVILAEVVKSCWVKSSWTGSMKTGADKEGTNEKSAEENREVEKERKVLGVRERGITSKESEWVRNQGCFKGLRKLCNCFLSLSCLREIT